MAKREKDFEDKIIKLQKELDIQKALNEQNTLEFSPEEIQKRTSSSSTLRLFRQSSSTGAEEKERTRLGESVEGFAVRRLKSTVIEMASLRDAVSILSLSIFARNF